MLFAFLAEDKWIFKTASSTDDSKKFPGDLDLFDKIYLLILNFNMYVFHKKKLNHHLYIKVRRKIQSDHGCQFWSPTKIPYYYQVLEKLDMYSH